MRVSQEHYRVVINEEPSNAVDSLRCVKTFVAKMKQRVKWYEAVVLCGQKDKPYKVRSVGESRVVNYRRKEVGHEGGVSKVQVRSCVFSRRC